MDIREHAEQYKNKWLILAVIILKVLMDGLDGSMLNIALPSIGKDLSVSSGSVIWIVSVYAITTAVTVLFFGRLGDIIGKTKFYLAGICIYMVSTFLRGTAQTFPMLVASRANPWRHYRDLSELALYLFAEDSVSRCRFDSRPAVFSEGRSAP